MRVYAIGDIHGCLDPLERLLEKIDDDLAGHEGEAHLVFLGDYVDRGPDSRGVIERLVAGPLPGSHAVFLMGNHEQKMVELLDRSADKGDASAWLAFGGDATMASYGVEPSDLLAANRPIEDVLSDIVPGPHRDFLVGLDNHHRIGDYLFVHAGIRPGVALEEQSARDKMWIRAPFLESKDDHGVHVVHGHTPTKGPDRRPNRTGIDTGCCYGGDLTAIRLESTQADIIAVRAKA